MTSPSAHNSLRDKVFHWIDDTDRTETRARRLLRMLVRILLITLNEFNRNNISLRSGALTFTIILSLVPLLAMSTSIVKGLGWGDELRNAAYSYLTTLDKSEGTEVHSSTEETSDNTSQPSPQAGLTGHLRLAVDKLFDYVDNTNFAALGTIGVIGILISVLLVFAHIETAMNAIWKVSSGRSLLRKIADYLTLLIIMPLSINIAFAAGAFLQNPKLAEKMSTFIPSDWIQTLLLRSLPILFIALSFYVLYVFFTNTRVKTLPALIGAVSAATLWFFMQNVYISLQLGVAKYNAIYGSFATLPLFLLWVYLGLNFILIGAQLAFACQNVHTYRLLAPTTAKPSHMLGAAYDIMDRVFDYFSSDRYLTRTELLDILEPHYPRSLIEGVLDQLQQSELVHFYHGDERIMPTHPIDKFDEQDVIDSILGSDAAATDGGRKSLSILRTAKTGALNES